MTASAHADFSTTFSVPPYKLGETIYGIEGWGPRMPNPEDLGLAARVVAVRWNDHKPALYLRGASIVNSFPKTEGSKVTVTAKLAVSFPEDGGNLHQVRIILNDAPFGEIVFDASRTTGGLGLGDGFRGTKVLLPHEEVKANSFYTFVVVVDYGQMTYDVKLTGVKRDGTPLALEQKAVPFEAKKTFLDSILILTATTTIGYLGELSIVSE